VAQIASAAFTLVHPDRDKESNPATFRVSQPMVAEAKAT
jgi:hypothetical protein